MFLKLRRPILFILLSAILSTVIGCQWFSREKKEDIRIALIGPMSGRDQAVGQAFSRGIRFLTEDLEINGRKVVIDEYDDQNNPVLAREEASRIAMHGSALAVIGHHYSTCSISAGEIYREYGIPAITPASTNVKVTENNPWYFRSSFNDRIQGRFLANYAKMVFGSTAASIIYENDEYGTYLAEVFEQTSKELGTEIRYKWTFNGTDRLLEDTLKQIVYELKTKEKEAGIIFLATHAAPGIKLIRIMKDALILNPVMGPDAFASEAFRTGFDTFPKERRSPGYYTNGMYVTTPLIFDTTNEKGQQFREKYRRTYSEQPGWHAAFAYDSALVLIHALKNAEIEGSRDSVAEDRRRIRNFLARMSNIDEAIEGATGFNYFDANGDARKPVLIGVYKNQNIISALTQFKAVTNPAVQTYLDSSPEKDKAVRFDNRYLYRINVVYTGVKINEIKDLDVKNLSCALDFHLWFRFQGEPDLGKFTFLNAIEPIQVNGASVILPQNRGREADRSPDSAPLTGPSIELIRKRISEDNLHYYLYRIKGRFRLDFLPTLYDYGEHAAGISFRHPVMDHNNLIYVKDVLGMGEIHDERALLEKIQEDQILSRASGWKVSGVSFFQDITEEISRGDPDHLDLSGGSVQYSRFNVGLRLVPDKFILRHIIPKNWIIYMLGASLFFFFFIPFLSRRRRFESFGSFFWLLHFVFALLLLVSAEYASINTLGGTYYLKPVILLIDMLWWFVPAFFLADGARRFIWNPLEESTGRRVPHVIKNALTLIIYVLAFFGVVAFVFDQPLTSLLASTGVAAMIFGLALQVNISNIFSGIAINLERPFRVGDWIKVGDDTEGKVIDINWRTTRIRSRDDTVISIPNSRASESSIENFSYPDEGYYKYFTVHIDPTHPPDRVKKILLDAALSAEGVEKEPPPATRFLGLTAGMTGQSESWAANYLVSVYVRDYGKKFAHNEAVWSNIWTHLKQAGIRHVIQRQEMLMVLEGIKRKKQIADRSLSTIMELDIFEPFSSEAKAYISRRMKRYHFFPGERIVQQGEAGNSLFIVEEGVVSIRVQFDKHAKPLEVAKMGAGNFFGEMALLTGEKRTASVISLTDSYIFEITKDDIAPLIEREPRLSRRLSSILSERKMDTEARKHTEEVEDFDKETIAAQIFSKIQDFFGFKK